MIEAFGKLLMHTNRGLLHALIRAPSFFFPESSGGGHRCSLVWVADSDLKILFLPLFCSRGDVRNVGFGLKGTPVLPFMDGEKE